MHSSLAFSLLQNRQLFTESAIQKVSNRTPHTRFPLLPARKHEAHGYVNRQKYALFTSDLRIRPNRVAALAPYLVAAFRTSPHAPYTPRRTTLSSNHFDTPRRFWSQ